MKYNKQTGLISLSQKDAAEIKRLNVLNASVNVTSAFVGDSVDFLTSLLTVGNEAVDKGSLNVEAGVQKTLFIPRFNADADQLEAAVETPVTANDSLTYDERSITPASIMFYDTVNPRNMENTWRPFQPTGPLVDRVDNPLMQAAILEEVMKSVSTQLGKIIWRGDTGGAADIALFDGYEKILAASGAIAPTPAGVITAANVISILEATEAAIPATIWGDPNVVFHMNTADYRLYLQASRALSFKGSPIAEAEEARFAGRQIRWYSGMTKDKIIVAKATAGRDSNLWAAIDVVGDDTNVKIERFRPESELFIVKVLFKFGVESPNPTETVLYLPA